MPTTTPSSRRKVAAHGTRSGYNRHLRRNEQPCEACNEANSKRASSRAYARAYQRALGRLRDRYTAEFDDLLAEERAHEEYLATYGDGAK